MLPYADRTKDKVHILLRVTKPGESYRDHRPLFIKGDDTPYGVTGWTFDEKEAKQFPANDETERFITSLTMEVRILHAEYPRCRFFDMQLMEASLYGTITLPGVGQFLTREADSDVTHFSIRTVKPTYGQSHMYTITPLWRHFPHNPVFETTFARQQEPHDLSSPH